MNSCGFGCLTIALFFGAVFGSYWLVEIKGWDFWLVAFIFLVLTLLLVPIGGRLLDGAMDEGVAKQVLTKDDKSK